MSFLKPKKTNLHDPFPKDQAQVFEKYSDGSVFAGCKAEIVSSWPLYDRQMFITGETKFLDFFNDRPQHMSKSSLYQPGMLANPQAFLIKSILVEGVTSTLRYGACELIIGSKIYGVMPAWLLGLKSKGFKLRYPLMIPPLHHFKFRISWEETLWLGTGVNGIPVLHHPLQVVLLGDMVRPMQ